MSTSEPPPSSSSSQESLNPYAAPINDLGDADLELEGESRDSEALRMRRAHLNHEAAIRTLGLLHYFGGLICGLVVCGAFLVDHFKGSNEAVNSKGLIPFIILTVVNLGLGFGLRRLQPWVRWTEASLALLGAFSTGLSLANEPVEPLTTVLIGFVLGFNLYVVYLLASRKGAVVFSPSYREVIEKTPYVRYKTSVILKVALVTLLGFLGLILILAVIGFVLAIQSGEIAT